MMTSKPNKKRLFFKPINSRLNKRIEKLDENPRRTGIVMAIILTVAFLIFIVRSVIYYSSPPPTIEPVVFPAINRPDSVKNRVTGTLEEYINLLQIQEELEKMQADPNNIDTARVNELYDILLK